MKYVSTRGVAPPLEFSDVLLTGLASDGGLYVPEVWPQLDHETLKSLRGLPYADVACRVIHPFVGNDISVSDLRKILQKAYSRFTHPSITPLTQLDSQLWLLELFHGPTLAFKDVALQLLGHLFDHVLEQRQSSLTLIGATSGDTGSSAIEACRGRRNLDIFILHPKGRVSDVQRKQMTTVADENIFNLAIEGDFDDCQDIVKSLFSDARVKARINLGAVNSINWARVMAQIVYYVYAAVNLGAPDRAIGFCVPTGNFGNIYAGYAARQMGLPVARLLCASNRNDILTRFYETGAMRKEPGVGTLSPSMDIQISSNFERLLFDLCDRRGDAVGGHLALFRAEGAYAVTPDQHRRFRTLFTGHRADDAATLAAMRQTRQQTGIVVDPHTAVGLAAAYATRCDREFPLVSLACAHPAKFPVAVARGAGVDPQLPVELQTRFLQPERLTVLPRDYETVADYILTHARRRA